MRGRRGLRGRVRGVRRGGHPWRGIRGTRAVIFGFVVLSFLTFWLERAHSQRPSGFMAGRASAANAAPHPAVSEAEGTLCGMVEDTTDAAVPDALVTLVDNSGRHGPMQVRSGGDGGFSFAEVPAGTYTMTVERDGFAQATSGAVLGAGQQVELGEISLTVAAREGVEVRASGRDVAEAQMALEEKQRVLGVFPNFYASYAPDAQPLSGGQKYRLALRFSVDPVAFAIAGVVAGSEQRAHTFPGYRQGASGYGKRLGAAYTDGLTSTMLGQAVFPALLRQDPRYFVKGTGSLASRLLYAAASTVMCKGDNKRWQMNYSNVLGNLGSAGISNAYYPSASRGVGLVVGNAMTATAMGAVGALFQEFLLHRMTPHVPDYGEVR